MEALRRLQDAFFAKGGSSTACSRWAAPHLQDAVPMSLGAGVPRLGHDDRRGGAAHRARSRQLLHEINLGATAIGTTVTAAPGYPALATKHLPTSPASSSSWPTT